MAPKAAAAAAGKPPRQQPSAAKTGYLVLYNAVSAAAWLVVLGRTAAACAARGPPLVHPAVGDWTKWTQTLAGLEVVHSLLGVVRAPLLTTLMQVASRFLLVWGVVHPFPSLAASPWYASMLLAWSVTEVIRYAFFAASLAAGAAPAALSWLRYNTFFVLYPLGISSECAMLWLATGPAGALGDVYKYAIYAVLAVYVPGSYVMYTHMMAQRRKVMRSSKATNEKAIQ